MTFDVRDRDSKQRVERLTPREREVFEDLVVGHSHRVIAANLNISPRTVEVHRTRIMEKTQAQSLPHLVRMAFEIGDRAEQSRNMATQAASHTACSKGQNPPNPEHSASIHRHPKMMCGLQERLSRIKGQLVGDQAKGILAMEEVIASLHDSGHEPFPGFTENMTAEFAGIREELGELDPNQPSNAQRFVAIAKRINFLSRTILFVAGYSLPTAETNTSAAAPRAGDAKP